MAFTWLPALFLLSIMGATVLFTNVVAVPFSIACYWSCVVYCCLMLQMCCSELRFVASAFTVAFCCCCLVQCRVLFYLCSHFRVTVSFSVHISEWLYRLVFTFQSDCIVQCCLLLRCVRPLIPPSVQFVIQLLGRGVFSVFCDGTTLRKLFLFFLVLECPDVTPSGWLGSKHQLTN